MGVTRWVGLSTWVWVHGGVDVSRYCVCGVGACGELGTCRGVQDAPCRGVTMQGSSTPGLGPTVPVPDRLALLTGLPQQCLVLSWAWGPSDLGPGPRPPTPLPRDISPVQTPLLSLSCTSSLDDGTQRGQADEPSPRKAPPEPQGVQISRDHSPRHEAGTPPCGAEQSRAHCSPLLHRYSHVGSHWLSLAKTACRSCKPMYSRSCFRARNVSRSAGISVWKGQRAILRSCGTAPGSPQGPGPAPHCWGDSR